MKNKVSLANAGYALFLLFFALEPLLGKWDAYWYALCGLAVVLGVVLVVGIVCIFRRKVSTDDCMDAIKKTFARLLRLLPPRRSAQLCLR